MKEESDTTPPVVLLLLPYGPYNEPVRLTLSADVFEVFSIFSKELMAGRPTDQPTFPSSFLRATYVTIEEMQCQCTTVVSLWTANTRPLVQRLIL